MSTPGHPSPPEHAGTVGDHAPEQAATGHVPATPAGDTGQHHTGQHGTGRHSSTGRRSIVVVAHNLRSAHNVGSLLRTGDVFAVDTVHVTGFTPYPQHPDDERDPIVAARQTRRLAKAAAGAEQTMPLRRHDDVHALLDSLRDEGYTVAGLEIDQAAVTLDDYGPSSKVALVLGDEVRGLDPELRSRCDLLLEIPMYGQKTSLNVSVAAGIALYALRAR